MKCPECNGDMRISKIDDKDSHKGDELVKCTKCGRRYYSRSEYHTAMEDAEKRAEEAMSFDDFGD